MFRVLHFAEPADAGTRMDFLGVPPGERDRLIADLRPYVIAADEGDAARTLRSALDRRGIVSAWGRRHLVFSVSSREQIDLWIGEDPTSEDAFRVLRETVERVGQRSFRVPCRDRFLDLAGPPKIMGILNVTPDSFSDGGNHIGPENAIRRGLEMAGEGADIVDVGGESSRPGSTRVGEEEELARVIPVIRGLAEKTGILLSVDTTKAGVAKKALEAGAHIVNDTSALEDDTEMAGVAASSGCAVVLMHRRGVPETMQQDPTYESLFDELLESLFRRMDAAADAGIPKERILIDPGIGFGKRPEDNLALHRHLDDLRNLGRPIVVGASRKAFLGRITGIETPRERIFGTAAAVTAAAMAGAHVLRVHDVKEMSNAAKVAAAIVRGREC
jgi:dihydropteroate synthase